MDDDDELAVVCCVCKHARDKHYPLEVTTELDKTELQRHMKDTGTCAVFSLVHQGKVVPESVAVKER